MLYITYGTNDVVMEETIVFNLFNSISFAFIAIVLLASYSINEIVKELTLGEIEILVFQWGISDINR